MAGNDPITNALRIAQQPDVRRWEMANDMLEEAPNMVPHRPHIANTNAWVDLGLKRALLEAAKGNHSRLAWTPGQEQADRYGLEKRFSSLAYDPEEQKLTAYGHGGDWSEHQATPEQLPDHIGKELAQRLLSSEIATHPLTGEKAHAISGPDLKTGGEGMRGFYDKLVPQRLAEIVKKLGHKAEFEPVRIQDYGDPEDGTEDYDKTLHSLKMTPELRASVLKGMPAFKNGGDVLARASGGHVTLRPPKKLYRGIVEGQQESGAQGLGTAHLGRGLYSSPSKSFAKMYATHGRVDEVPVEHGWPKNPLVLRGAGGAESLLLDHVFRNTNFRNAREFNAAYPDRAKFLREHGYDGVVAGDEVVRFPEEGKDRIEYSHGGDVLTRASGGHVTLRAAGVMLHDPEDRILFVKRAHKAGDHGGKWAFPGGKIEHGESAHEAAARETHEEIGHRINGHMGAPVDRRVSKDGVEFTTFKHRVPRQFTPKLNEEHTEHRWAHPNAAPEPLHPGVKATLDKLASGGDVLVRASGGSATPHSEHARQMGFEPAETWYHGTTKDFPSFVPKRAPRNEQMALSGVHLAQDPAFASLYAEGNGGNIVPVHVRGKYLDATQLVPHGSEHHKILDALLKGTGTKPYWDRDGNGNLVAPPIQGYIDQVRPQKAERVLRDFGYDGVRYSAKHGAYDPVRRGMTNVSESHALLVFDPKNIRARTAKFANDESHDLMAAHGGAIDHALRITARPAKDHVTKRSQ